MRLITARSSTDADSKVLRTLTLKVLGGYVSLVALVNAWRVVAGGGSIPLLLLHGLVLTAIVVSLKADRSWPVVDWLPLIVLPMLYWELPMVSLGGGRMFDAMVQRWDVVLFGSELARTLAGALPSRLLSEVLHLAYLLYYAIIYVPPAVMYAAKSRRGYYETVFALTVTVVISFVAFSVFPVEGPRFVWGAPPGVPSGPIRLLTLLVLEHGSARGTAFPSSHVAIALAQSLSTLRWRRTLGIWVTGTTALLAIGAVYGGFHYPTDVLAGTVVGLGAWGLARGGVPRGRTA